MPWKNSLQLQRLTEILFYPSNSSHYYMLASNKQVKIQTARSFSKWNRK